METVRRWMALGIVLFGTGAGMALAANTNWYTVNSAYGTGGLSAPLAAPSYSYAQAIDVNDSTHGVYTMVSTAPGANATGSAYLGPFSVARRLSTGALDTAYGSGGLMTSFSNSSNSVYQYSGLCVDPLTHNIVAFGGYTNGTAGQSVVRLLHPSGAGAAALDTSFNPSGTTPGIVNVSAMHDISACSVQGDQSIVLAGRDASTPSKAVIVRLLANGTLDGSFGSAGVATFTPPNGQNWEAGSGAIFSNGSQTVNQDIIVSGDTYPTGNASANVAALIALDRCTGAPDANFNGNGFLSVPAIDTFVFSGMLGGAILPNGHLLLALAASASNALDLDLVEWAYPLAANQYLSPTYPGVLTASAGSPTLGTGGKAAPVIQADGSVLFGVESSSNQDMILQLVGTSTLGFTVAAPAVFNCGATAAVPNVVGLAQAAATTAITGAGLALGTVTQQSSSTVAAGSVISESPSAGTTVTTGSVVNIVVSSGVGQVSVPNVVNLLQAAAATALQNASLVVGTVTQQASSTVASGAVISQSPAAGASASAGSSVNLVVSSGPAPVLVPNVIGMTQAAAGTAITAAGLIVGSTSQQSSSTVAAGLVISESPAAGASVTAGSAVGLVVSSGPAMAAVPNVVGMTQAAATSSITNAGLVLGTVTQQSSSTVASGAVISQSPAAAASVASGSAVNLTVSSGPATTGGATSSGSGGGGGGIGWLGVLLLALAVMVKHGRVRVGMTRISPATPESSSRSPR